MWAQVGLASYLGAGCDVFSFLEGHGAEGIYLVSLTGILEPGPIWTRQGWWERQRSRCTLVKAATTALRCWKSAPGPHGPMDHNWASPRQSPSGPTRLQQSSSQPVCVCACTCAHAWVSVQLKGSHHRPMYHTLLP